MIKFGHSPPKRLSPSLKALENDKNAFCIISRYLNFCVDILAMQKKGLDWREKVNFKIYDVTAWLTKTKTNIAQYLSKKRQSDNGISSGNKI